MLPKSISILPHPPELLSCYEELKKEVISSETYKNYKSELEKLFEINPSTIIIVQSHGGIHPDGVTFHVPDGQQYNLDYTSYGYPDKNSAAIYDQSLAHFIQKSLHEHGRQTHIINQAELSLPALILSDMALEMGKILPRLVVLGVSLEGSQAHYEYGSLIGRALAADKDQIAVVISGQLSHCLTKDSVAGYIPIAKNYDKQVQEYVKDSKWESFMNIDPFEIQEVGEDLYRPLSLGLGIFNALKGNVTGKISSYESTQGIGYMCGGLEKGDE